MASMIGTTISHYRILAAIGDDATGTLWRAEDVRLGRVVTLRLLAPELMASAEARERFLNEAHEAALAGGSGTPVDDAGEADGQVFVAYRVTPDEPAAPGTVARDAEPLVERSLVPLLGETLPARLARWWRRQTRRRFGPVQVAGVAALVLAVALAVQFAQRTARLNEPRVLAVLPMRIVGGDSTEASPVVHALGEELVTRFAAAGGFDVLPWVTTGRARPDSIPLTQLARDLRANLLLSGDVRVEDDGVEVHAELVDGRKGTTIWVGELRGPSRDYLSLQSRLVLGVASRLGGRRLKEVRLRLEASLPRNPEAYELFIRGANFFHSNDPAEVALVEPLLRQAVLLDSTLAAAWVALGAVHTDRHFRAVGGGYADLVEAEAMFTRALALQPGLPVAERGVIRLAHERAEIVRGGRWRMLEIASQALQRDPHDVDQLLTAGWGFTLGGLPALAVPVFDRILRLDPHNQAAAWFRVVALSWSGKPKQCIEASRAYVRQFGEDPEVYTWMGQALMDVGRSDEGVVVLERSVELFDGAALHYSRAMLALALQRSGRSKRGREVMERAQRTDAVQMASVPDNLRLAQRQVEYFYHLNDLVGTQRAIARLQRMLSTVPGSAPPPGRYVTYGGYGGFLASILARHGRMAEALAVLRTISPDDDREPWNDLGILLESDDSTSRAVVASDEFKRLQAAVRAIHRSAFARYRAIVARALPGEPDVPPAEPASADGDGP
jgi:TolB-like protein